MPQSHVFFVTLHIVSLDMDSTTTFLFKRIICKVLKQIEESIFILKYVFEEMFNIFLLKFLTCLYTFILVVIHYT